MRKSRMVKFREDVFITTQNVEKMNALADQLLVEDITSSIGIVVGVAGRGKTFAAKRYYAQNHNAFYVYCLTSMTISELYSQIVFLLTGQRIRHRLKALEAIQKATLNDEKKLIIIDEADKATPKVIDAIRDLNELCELPVLLVGEEKLLDIMNSARRLRSRVRAKVVFEPLTLTDVTMFYSEALPEVKVENPKIFKELHKRSRGDFRILKRDAKEIVKLLNINNTNVITNKILESLYGN